MWSLIIFDLKKNKFIACRDRYGVKPLYYRKLDNNYYFSSEVKQLLLLNEKNVIWGYSTNDWPPAPNRIAEFIKYGFFDSSRYLGYVFEKVDQISDTDGHPAEKSHELYATRICDWLLSRHGAELASIAGDKQGATS